ncbi:Uncharacterised protein [Escherichia coli]|uniref:Uncharacterized protein n=1 Tax=Escherichia coli TaxID=562 RepID=A0A376WSA4_ECOLX|nr:Uncharacterised protein [Escherichia coli]
MIWIMLATLAVVFVVGFRGADIRGQKSDSPSQRSAEHRCRTRGVDGRSNGKVSW